jgi:hypothetical protein
MWSCSRVGQANRSQYAAEKPGLLNQEPLEAAVAASAASQPIRLISVGIMGKRPVAAGRDGCSKLAPKARYPWQDRETR